MQEEDGGRIKAAGKMGHVDFLNWVQKKLQEGWQIYSCYEAGASGYWLHRESSDLPPNISQPACRMQGRESKSRGASIPADIRKKRLVAKSSAQLK
jgi:hypothetical protein